MQCTIGDTTTDERHCSIVFDQQHFVSHAALTQTLFLLV
jgi:hypothetical protein